MFRDLYDKHWPLFYGFENLSFASFCVYSMLIWKHSALPELLAVPRENILPVSEKAQKMSKTLMSRDARKPVFGVSDQVRHKTACAVSEAG